MQFLVLSAFVVVLLLLEMPISAEPSWLIAPALVVYFTLAALICQVGTLLSLRSLRGEGELTSSAIRAHGLMSLASRIWLVAGLGGLVLLGYGKWVMIDLHLGAIPLAGKAVVLAPFIAALLLTWYLEYPFYAVMKRQLAAQQMLAGTNIRPGWTLGEYLAYNVRHHLLFIAVLVGLIILIYDILSLYVGPPLPENVAYYVLPGGTAAGALLVFLFAPLLIVRIWRTRRMGDGELRSELENLCRELKFKCRDILIWQSGGMVVNAGVMGLLGRLRYILLTDALLEHMDRRCIKAIFAHEAGHIISHHIFYSAIFAVTTVVFSVTGAVALAAVAGWDDWTVDILSLAVLLAAWGIGFGYLSRRFERQSDVLAAWAVDRPSAGEDDGRITPEGAATFAWALQRVAQLNGIPQGQFNWRHGSIAKRVRYVLHLGGTGGGRGEIDKTVHRIKMGLWVALGAAITIIALQAAGGGR